MKPICSCDSITIMLLGRRWILTTVCDAHESVVKTSITDDGSAHTYGLGRCSGPEPEAIGTVDYVRQRVYISAHARSDVLKHELGHILAWELGLENTEGEANMVRQFIDGINNLIVGSLHNLFP
jgi:hypothetical protein